VTTFLQGSTAQLVASWLNFPGGSAQPVTAVTIGIVRISNGAVALATTSTGVTYPATGVNAYNWVVGATAAADYLVTWTAIDPQGDTIQATEVVTVAASISTYGDLATLKAMLAITDTSRDALLLSDLTAAKEQIDNMTGRSFLPAATASTKTLRLENRVDTEGNLIVPDIASLTGLVVESGTPAAFSTVAATSYYAAPENAIAAGKPITWLRSAYLTTPWAYSPYVRITAFWGWPATPASVTKAGLLLASRLYARRLSPEGVIGSPDWGGGLRVARTDADVQALLSAYMLPGFA
jgi:hypothetical protein